MLIINNYLISQKHPFHLVKASPWPFLLSASLFNTVIGLVMYLHNYNFGGKYFFIGYFMTIFVLAAWWRDVIIEGTFEGHHTKPVQKGLRLGVILFIVSEIMFFFSFFWAFFHSSLSPAIQIGGIWPPKGIETINYLGIPLLNTLLLLLSGATVTWHHYLLTSNKINSIAASDTNKSILLRSEIIFSLALTIFLGFIFLLFQVYEYIHAPFTLSDGIYGSTFYLLTGFHGFHVLVGTIFLFVCLIRYIKQHFTEKHHIGLEAAIWYWHFVDVVWLFLYITLYGWGSV